VHSASSTEISIETPRGPAGVRITDPAGPPISLLVLGHGAGGGVDAPDLIRVHDTAVAAGVRVALVTQPYRMAGRRSPAPAAHLDEAWTTVVRALTDPALANPALVNPALPLICGGRSSGARVACRTAKALGAAGVLALAFPLHPPGKPDRSRAAELPVDIPTLVLNGDRDPFGVPDPTPNVTVVVRPGATHDLRKDLAGTAKAALTWLGAHGWCS
jgi:predicted alpha/beta-hydrolase family hydrolase